MTVAISPQRFWICKRDRAAADDDSAPAELLSSM
jgi:hypothetical protein